jgi:hypothetical protein
MAKVNEYAEHHDASCSGFPEYCVAIYKSFGFVPASDTGAPPYIWEANVFHYWPGFQQWGVNVRGYAHHWNLTISPGSHWTTSDGY